LTELPASPSLPEMRIAAGRWGGQRTVQCDGLLLITLTRVLTPEFPRTGTVVPVRYCKALWSRSPRCFCRVDFHFNPISMARLVSSEKREIHQPVEEPASSHVQSLEGVLFMGWEM